MPQSEKSINLKSITSVIRKHANPKRAAISKMFFKTQKGQYGYGDVFLGLTVPLCRKIAVQHLELSLIDCARLLHSRYHEERLVALILMVEKYRRGDGHQKKEIAALYLKYARRVNNWDLVDLSAYHIVGAHLENKSVHLLKELARSNNIWERRIAMVACFHDIRKGQYQKALEIARMLLEDKEELIHKAVGWMLREVGKRCSQTIMEDFLCRYLSRMNSITLRYAIERLPPKRRQEYLESKAKLR